MKKLFSHLIFVKIIEFRSFLENRPETVTQFPPLLLRSAGLENWDTGAAGGEWEAQPRRNQKILGEGARGVWLGAIPCETWPRRKGNTRWSERP